MSPHKTL